MDAYYDIVSLRAVREYSERPISDKAVERILQAGRAAGSSQNRQPWTFFVVRSPETLDQIAETVYAPENLRHAQLAIAISTSGKGSFDIGRCAENMMLAAWSEGIGSSPNGIRDAEALAPILGTKAEHSIVTVLSFGCPAKPARTSGDVQGILQRIKRKPLDDIVVWVE
jgi:nitroreductase